MNRPPWRVSPYYIDRAKERFDELVAKGVFDWDAIYPGDTLPPPFHIRLPDFSITNLAYSLDRAELADAHLMAMEGWFEYEKAREQKLREVA